MAAVAPPCFLAWYVLVSSLPSGAIAAPPEDVVPNVPHCNTTKTTAGSTFSKNLQSLLSNLSATTPTTGSSTSSQGTSPDAVYGVCECYTSNAGNCGQCIKSVTDDLHSKCPLAVGATIYQQYSPYNCYLRYENYNFSLATDMAHPPRTSDGTNSNTSKIVLGTVIPSLALFIAAAALVAYFKCSKPRREDGSDDYVRDDLRVTRAYRYVELQAATDGFAERNQLGRGGFGAVYKGILGDGREVAVKKLFLAPNAGNRDFVNEINIISSIRHRNLVRLDGYCIEGEERMLVLEYIINGSLSKALFDGNSVLDWPRRYKIVLGIARGLAYLHEESHVQIIHRDVKASNILLDSKFDAKISDFGISKLFDRDRDSSTSTRIAGTYGYLAPEYVFHGKLTAKADVFSFGVLVLEIVSGRMCKDPSLPADHILEWAWKLHCDGRSEGLTDPRVQLSSETLKVEALRTLEIALLCTQMHAEHRPTMRQVVAMLQSYLQIPPVPSQPPAYLGMINVASTNTSGTSFGVSSRSGETSQGQLKSTRFSLEPNNPTLQQDLLLR